MNTDPTHDPAAADPATPDDLMRAAAERIAALEAERDDFKDRWMRAEAETANVRARAKREVDETRQFAVQKFARDVVEAAENIRRGLDSLPPPADGEPEIVARCARASPASSATSLAVLERNGIRREDPTGALFDPNLHQAMAEQQTDAAPAGHRPAGLDAGLDAERPPAAPGDGGGGQGARPPAERCRRRAGRYRAPERRTCTNSAHAALAPAGCGSIHRGQSI